MDNQLSQNYPNENKLVNIAIKNSLITFKKENETNALNINKLNIPKIDNSKLCVICLVSEKNTAFFRCGHMVCCKPCALKIRNNNANGANKENKCPVCRREVVGTLRIYN